MNVWDWIELNLVDPNGRYEVKYWRIELQIERINKSGLGGLYELARCYSALIGDRSIVIPQTVKWFNAEDLTEIRSRCGHVSIVSARIRPHYIVGEDHYSDDIDYANWSRLFDRPPVFTMIDWNMGGNE